MTSSASRVGMGLLLWPNVRVRFNASKINKSEQLCLCAPDYTRNISLFFLLCFDDESEKRHMSSVIDEAVRNKY